MGSPARAADVRLGQGSFRVPIIETGSDLHRLFDRGYVTVTPEFVLRRESSREQVAQNGLNDNIWSDLAVVYLR
jgi:hypothetical protein